MNIEIFDKFVKLIKDNINPSDQKVFSRVLLVLGTFLLFLIIFKFSEESKDLDPLRIVCLVCTLIFSMGMLHGVLFGSKLVKYSIFFISAAILLVSNTEVKSKLLNANISESAKQIVKLPLDFIFAIIVIFAFIYSVVDFVSSSEPQQNLEENE